MARVIMVQGTMSGVGKSLIVAGLCRIFKQEGYKVAPFKSQNMALNSYITEDGLEMGRAQVMQAEAAGVRPDCRMNPILLKPTNNVGSQVIINGRAIGNMSAVDYFEFKKGLLPIIKNAYDSLASEYDIIVIEGAGSPAEINLKQNDIVNMGMARLANAPVLLVGDIDRGGVFAQLLGTLMLLEEDEKAMVKGLVVNKFRGDKSLLASGIDELNKRGGCPVVGVVPYMDISLDDEDSQTERFEKKQDAYVNIAVIKLPRMSNISDFTVFEIIDGVAVHYVTRPGELLGKDMIIIPGSKNTLEDMNWLKESGFVDAIKSYSIYIPIFGICGGFQMLGQMIYDPDKIESGVYETKGLGLLDIYTILAKQKHTVNVDGDIGAVTGPFEFLSGKKYTGYEIHHGISKYIRQDLDEAADMSCISFEGKAIDDVVINKDNVYGTYIHGFFDEGDIAVSIVKYLAKQNGVEASFARDVNYKAYKEQEYDRLADILREHMDMSEIYKIIDDRC